MWEGLYSGCHVVTSLNIGQLDYVKKYGHVIISNSVDEWKAYLIHACENLETLRSNRIQHFNEYRSMTLIARELVSIFES